MRRCLPFLTTLLFAATAAAQPAVGREERLAEAQRLHQEAAGIRTEAERRHGIAQQDCWDKVLVSGCQEDARKAMRLELERARGLERQAREIEREVKRQEIAERDAKRLEEAPARAAAAAERAEKNRQSMEQVQRRVDRKRAEAEAREP